MNMFFSNRTKIRKSRTNKFLFQNWFYHKRLPFLLTKAEGLGIEIVVGNHETFSADESFSLELYYNIRVKTELF